jgi:hypothetical protein
VFGDGGAARRKVRSDLTHRPLTAAQQAEYLAACRIGEGSKYHIALLSIDGNHTVTHMVTIWLRLIKLADPRNPRLTLIAPPLDYDVHSDAFAGLALSLAGIGVYAIVSFLSGDHLHSQRGRPVEPGGIVTPGDRRAAGNRIVYRNGIPLAARGYAPRARRQRSGNRGQGRRG